MFRSSQSTINNGNFNDSAFPGSNEEIHSNDYSKPRFPVSPYSKIILKLKSLESKPFNDFINENRPMTLEVLNLIFSSYKIGHDDALTLLSSRIMQLDEKIEQIRNRKVKMKTPLTFAKNYWEDTID